MGRWIASRCGSRAPVVGKSAVAAVAYLLSAPATAQVATPANQEQARLRAERDAAERAQREQTPVATLPQTRAAGLGPFPTEQPCFSIGKVVVDGADRRELRWIGGYLQRYRDRCIGSRGLEYIVRDVQAQFLDRGLVTTRAGLPEQDLSSGTLRIVVVPGVIEGIRITGRKNARTWDRAAPIGTGDVINLRALEQSVEQLRSVPGREVTLDLRPGERPGGTILDVTMRQHRPIAASVGINNFAGERVGRYQGFGQIAELGQLGFSEVIGLFYNRRVDVPGVPADSRGYGGSLSVPLGWWTVSASASANRYSQTVLGQFATIETRGRLDRATIAAERVFYRDQTSKASFSIGLGKRWAHNYINDVEIQIQRQNLTELELRLNGRSTFGRVRIDASTGVRFGLGILGAQAEPDDRPAALPSARYRIISTDLAASIALGRGFMQSYRVEFHGQVSDKTLYGSDLVQVGGPYTVRGLDSDTAELGRDGYYVRQELGAVITPRIRPYALFDFGQVRDGSGLRGGAGLGLRAEAGPVVLDLFGARPVFGRNINDRHRVRFGLSAAIGI